MHEWGVGSQGGLDIANRRQLFYVQDDGRDSRLSLGLGVSHHARDRLAFVADHIRGEERLVLHKGTGSRDGGICRREDTKDTRALPCGAHVEFSYGTGRNRGAEKLREEHASFPVIDTVRGFAADLRLSIGSRQACADETRHRDVSAVARKTASTICAYPVQRQMLPAI